MLEMLVSTVVRNYLRLIKIKMERKLSRTNHWEAHTRFYSIYSGIIARCYRKYENSFKNYWMFWIECEWLTYEDFKKDMYKSYLKHIEKYWEKDTTIDRIDVLWNYCKSNCRWATRKEQSRNKSTTRRFDYKWKRLTAMEIYEKEKPNVEYETFRWRLRKWWSVERALSTPNWREM